MSLGELYIHALNTRSEPPDAEIAALADSIAAQGLLQNLMGIRDPAGSGRIGIVAGGRRLRAITMLADRGDWAENRPVPVLVTDSEDLAAAWAGTENEARQGLHPADEVRAYRDLRRRGRSTEAIARHFAVTAAHVNRRLALAALPETALMALRAGTLSLDDARVLTLARTERQAKTVLEQLLSGKISRWQLRETLTGKSVTATGREARYVGVEAYRAAGGGVTEDLFAEQTYLHDTDLLARLATEKATAETEALRKAGGWAWSLFRPNHYDIDWNGLAKIDGTEPDLPEGDWERLEELEDTADLLDAEGKAELDALRARTEPVFSDEDRATGGIITTLSHAGALRLEGFFRRLGAAPAADPAEAEGDDGPAPARPAPEAAMAQSLRDDLTAIRLLALQNALAAAPETLLDLLAWQLQGTLAPWTLPLALSTTQPRNAPAKSEGTHVPAFLASPDYGREDPTAEAFAAFRAKGRAHRDAVLAQALARLYARPTGNLAEALAAEAPPPVRALWTPTAAGFLGRVSVASLDRLWAELVPPSDLDPAHATFRGLKKAEKAKRLEALFSDLSVREAMGLSREQNAAIDAWLPEELRFAAPGAGA